MLVDVECMSKIYPLLVLLAGCSTYPDSVNALHSVDVDGGNVVDGPEVAAADMTQAPIADMALAVAVDMAQAGTADMTQIQVAPADMTPTPPADMTQLPDMTIPLHSVPPGGQCTVPSQCEVWGGPLGPGQFTWANCDPNGPISTCTQRWDDGFWLRQNTGDGHGWVTYGYHN